MRQPPTNICPLHGRTCLEDDCALWDYSVNKCAVVSIAEGITDIAAELRNRKGESNGCEESA